MTDTVGRLLGGGDDDGGSSRSYSDRASDLQSAMDQVGDRLQASRHTEFRVVTLPEQMALAETNRLLGQLDEAGVPTDTVLVNKTLAEPPGDCPNCAPRYERQQAVLDEARETVGRDVVEVPLAPEADGLDRVETVAEHLPDVN